MATIMELLSGILNPNPGAGGLLSQGGYLQSTGLGPEQLARYHQASGMGGGAPAAPPQGGTPDAIAPQQPPMPVQTAPAAPSGGGIGGLLSGLFGGASSGKNETISWLQQQGMDPGTATLMAGNKQALQQYLLQRSQGADPLKALEAEKLGLEIAGMRSPKPDYNFITGRDGAIFRTDDAGNMQQVYGGKPDQPTDVQEYEYAKGQGYTGSFQDFQLEQKRAGASQVNIDQKAEGAFDKKLAENQATIFTEMATEGLNAKADLAVLGELEGLLGQTGGTLSGISGALAKYGIGGAGMSDIQAAQALINKLVPTQRQPGSGTMSDRDVELFTRSLPSLWNAPGGNQKILNVMRGLAQYKQMQGQIATAVMNGDMSRQDAAKALQSIPNPLAEFKAGEGGAAPAAPPPAPGQPDPERFGGKQDRLGAPRRLKFNPATGALE